MRIVPVKPRSDFHTFLQEEAGYHPQGEREYIESSFVIAISPEDKAFLASVAEETYKMCLAAVDKVIAEDRFADFGIGALQRQHIIASWKREGGRDPELYGRFDFCWDGARSVKFYEINADTPTTSYECSVVQWLIVQDLIERGQLPADTEQFNTLEDDIVAYLSSLRPAKDKGLVHFTCMTEWKEDVTTTSYLEALAEKAGWNVRFLDIGLIGANEDITSPDFGNLYDEENVEIRDIYKLMPWEHWYEVPYAPYFAKDKIRFLEPPWKAILSNKMLSVLLWEMYPGHPYLLPAYKTSAPLGNTYVEKPIFGRISANIKVVENGRIIGQRQLDPDEPTGNYAHYPKIYQQFHPLPELPGMPAWRYQTGLWVVGNGKAAGADFRVDRSIITGGDSMKFFPHVIMKESLDI